MLNTIRQNPKRQCLHATAGFLLCSTVSDNAWEFDDLCDPAAIDFAIEFKRKSH